MAISEPFPASYQVRKLSLQHQPSLKVVRTHPVRSGPKIFGRTDRGDNPRLMFSARLARAVHLVRSARECSVAGAERLAGNLVSPAHPGDRGLGMIAKLLRYPSGTATLAEGLDRPGHGLPDFLGTGMVTALQCGHEQGIGPDDTNTDVVPRWPHHEPPSTSCSPPHLRGPALLTSIWRSILPGW
jgi:hypothetical protein